MNLSNKRGVPSALGPRIIKPAVERTEVEKIRLAQRFLESRGYVVMPRMIAPAVIADVMGCSTQHVLHLSREDSTFPKGYDMANRLRDKEPERKYRRFPANEVRDWLESRKETTQE